MPKQRNWTESQLVDAVKNSTSLAQVLQKLNLRSAGGTHAHIKKIIQKMQLDTSHFTGQLWSKGKTALEDSRVSKKDTSKFFVENSVAAPSYIRRLVIKYKLIPYKCVCGIENSWQSATITLQLDHKDGDRKNHKLENLRFLCPNCHSQTTTFCGKNKSKVKVSDEILVTALKTYPNIRQALVAVGLDNGRNYSRAKKLLLGIKALDTPK